MDGKAPQFPQRPGPAARRAVLRVVLAYAVFAGLWILLSDRAAETLFRDPASLVQVSLFKGWFFVAVTSLLLFVMLRRLVDRLAAGEAEVRRQQEERRQTLMLFHGLAEASPDAIYVKDPEGRYLLFNRAAGRMTGKACEAVLGRDDRAIFPLEEAETLRAEDRRIMAGSEVSTLEEWLTTPEGPRCFQAIKGPLRAKDGRLVGLFGITRDITDRVRSEEARLRLESEVQHAQRLESLGRLASGVAHDMNNVLAAIHAATELLRVQREGDAALVKSLDTVLMATRRGRDLVKGLTAFARKGLGGEPEALDLNELVREEAALLERTLLQRVEVVLELTPDLPRVRGERSSLGNALMNLCVNAVDAMPQGGTLTLRTRALEGRVELAVADTGEGMPPEVLARATDPFFTTKPVGKGTGLGLATVHSVAAAHQGALELHSDVGHGTCVRLLLPVLEGTSAGPAVRSPEAAQGSVPRRILLVDDDDLVRQSLAGLLASGGHRVETAPDGASALRHLESGGAIDLVVLDLNMKGLDGAETLARLRRLRPELPVLLVSGFLEALPGTFMAEQDRVRTLAKPFGLDQFQGRLRELGL
ncbi:MAG: Blue-light-activated protein [Acidobacteria bacterium ADurb.Bin340]|nr:MAG: Blue-light-activated protein [Acidobacteria bacterium ADurb.Bin340]